MNLTLFVLVLNTSLIYASPLQTEVARRKTSQYSIYISASKRVSAEKEKIYRSPYAKTKNKLLINKDKTRNIKRKSILLQMIHL